MTAKKVLEHGGRTKRRKDASTSRVEAQLGHRSAELTFFLKLGDVSTQTHVLWEGAFSVRSQAADRPPVGPASASTCACMCRLAFRILLSEQYYWVSRRK